MTDSVHQDNFYRDTPLAQTVPTRTAKNAPYPPRHRDYFPAKEPGKVPGWLRRVTLTYFIAVPLAVITLHG